MSGAREVGEAGKAEEGNKMAENDSDLQKGNGGKIVVIRSDVPDCSNYREYEPYLRHDFWYSCAYCNISEVEAMGIGFNIDHYDPSEKDGNKDDSYNNLMWSCERCNSYKQDLWPPDEARQNGIRYVKLDIEDPRDHFESRGIRVVGITKAGEFTEKAIRLNRLQLRRIRQIRRKIYENGEQVLLGLHALAAKSLDRINPKFRVRFLNLRKEMLAVDGEIDELIEGLSIREWNKSPLLDKDPEVKEHTKERREYLKELQAIYPDPWRKPRRKKKKKK